MKRLAGFLIFLFFIIYMVIYISILNIPAVMLYDEGLPSSANSEYVPYEELLYNFISRGFVDENGRVITNLKSYQGSGDTLSESVGLFMQYCVLDGKREQFDREVKFLKEKMLTDKHLVRWRVGKSNAGCNAAIDDLRIIRALTDASEKWGEGEYADLAGFLQEGLFSFQVNGRNLYEFYDWMTEKNKHRIPLCYLDLYTMDGLSEFNRNWLNIEERGLSIIYGGRISDGSPFYFKYYDYDSGGYAFDEEYRQDKGICLTYTLITAIHLAEVNEESYALTQWLKSEIDKGPLYAWYNPHTLKPVNGVKSTAVYALAAAYADKTGERELYSRLIDQMLKFSVQDKKSRYYGGFGDPTTGYFHAFDNLTALWSLALANH